MRITAKQVDAMFARAVRAASALGMDTTEWQLIHGSSTYGNLYVLRNMEYEGSWHSIGLTRREAHASLYNMAVAWEVALRIDK